MKALLLRLLAIDGVMLASGAGTLLGIQIAEGFGVSIEQIYAVLLAVCAVAYMLLRMQVDRVMKALDDVQDLKERVAKLEGGSGPHQVYEPQTARGRR